MMWSVTPPPTCTKHRRSKVMWVFGWCSFDFWKEGLSHQRTILTVFHSSLPATSWPATSPQLPKMEQQKKIPEHPRTSECAANPSFFWGSAGVAGLSLVISRHMKTPDIPKQAPRAMPGLRSIQGVHSVYRSLVVSRLSVVA